MSNTKPKIIVTMRHGERADFVGLKPYYGKYDPELTKNGEQQALNAGKLFSEQLGKIGLEQASLKISVCSSPFIRTLQTGRGLIKGFIDTNKQNHCPNQLNLECLLSEFINYEFGGHFPKDFLNSIKQGNDFKEEFKGYELNMPKSFESLPQVEEDDDDLKKRIKTFLSGKLPAINASDNDVTVLISHGSPLSDLNEQLDYDGPYGYQYVHYCQMYFYTLDKDNKTTFINTIYPQ